MNLGEKEYRSIQNWEGLKNFEDIYDNPTWEDLEKESNLRVEERFDRQKISKSEQELLDRIRSFCLDVNKITIEEMSNFFLKYSQAHSVFTSKIVDYLKKLKWDRPRFVISNGQDSKELLQKLLDRKQDGLDRGSFLLVYQLPIPVAQFWDKGGVNTTDGYRYWGDRGKKLGSGIIEWGSMYREMVPVVWEVEEMKKYSDLVFQRLNDFSEHDPKHYYYVWRVTKKSLPNLERDFEVWDGEDSLEPLEDF